MENKIAAKFKLGDRVKLTDVTLPQLRGKIGRIIKIELLSTYGQISYTVAYKDSTLTPPQNNMAWYTTGSNLELVVESKLQSRYNKSLNGLNIINTQVFGFVASIGGMRNPKNSWGKSDSRASLEYRTQPNEEGFVLGEADAKLASTLTKAGSEHCKFLRSIQVWADLKLPRYIWSEFDTYKFHTSNSTSTMHKLHSRELTKYDFIGMDISEDTLAKLNDLIYSRKGKLITSDEFIRQAKRMLPEGYLQLRTINTNYAELLNIYMQRRNHRLIEWRVICDWIENLPYFKKLTGIDIKEKDD